MTALRANDVEGFLRRPDLEAGVFLVYGPDAGLVREIGHRLSSQFAAGDAESIVTLDGAELDAEPGRLTVEVRTSSLFGGRRIVRVRGAGKALVPAVTDLLADPGDAVLVLEAGNLPPRDPLRALVEAGKLGRTLPCYPDSERDLQRMISESFAEAGVQADGDVAGTLRDLLGNDREVTRREIEKLTLFAAGGDRLTRADVLALCADNAALVLDAIVDATGTGHAARLEAALERALAAAISPQQILATAGQHFLALRRWRGDVDAGRTPRDVLERSRPKPHFSRRQALEQQLRLWPDEVLGAALERLRLATAESRRRYALQETVVRRALLGICMLAAER